MANMNGTPMKTDRCPSSIVAVTAWRSNFGSGYSAAPACTLDIIVRIKPLT